MVMNGKEAHGQPGKGGGEFPGGRGGREKGEQKWALSLPPTKLLPLHKNHLIDMGRGRGRREQRKVILCQGLEMGWLRGRIVAPDRLALNLGSAPCCF